MVRVKWGKELLEASLSIWKNPEAGPSFSRHALYDCHLEKPHCFVNVKQHPQSGTSNAPRCACVQERVLCSLSWCGWCGLGGWRGVGLGSSTAGGHPCAGVGSEVHRLLIVSEIWSSAVKQGDQGRDQPRYLCHRFSASTQELLGTYQYVCTRHLYTHTYMCTH